MKYETALGTSVFFPDQNLLYIRLQLEDTNLQLTKLNFEQNFHQLGERNVEVLIDACFVDFIRFPKEVMEYMSDNPYIKYQLSNALLIKGLAQRILGNFYLNISRPKVKTKLFTNLQEALRWQKIRDIDFVHRELEF